HSSQRPTNQRPHPDQGATTSADSRAHFQPGTGLPPGRSGTNHRKKAHAMKFAVIGGTGLIGSRVVENLNAAGHQAVPHSLSTGVDIITGQGLEAAVAGADVVINLTNSPTFDDASLAFFQTSMDNLLAASEKAGIGHFVTLSIVGVDQVPDLDYYRAKVLQENILRAGPIPYSIVRATQFMEFIDATLSMTTDGDTVHLPRTPIQPIAAADVSSIVAEVAAGSPLNGVVNIAGPDVYPLDELGRLTLTAKSDGRPVVTDDTAGMFAAVHGDVLTAPDDARIAPTHYTDWLS
ncbi:MAG: SDR family oxidoreductase, partial [Pseudonocardiaceae bacterium]